MSRKRPSWVSGLEDDELHANRMMTRCLWAVWIIFLLFVALITVTHAADRDRERMQQSATTTAGESRHN